MWCVMCDARCVMFQTWFFVRSWLYESREDQKHPIWVISDLFNDITKLIPGGSRMYTKSCKASYIHSSSFNTCPLLQGPRRILTTAAPPSSACSTGCCWASCCSPSTPPSRAPPSRRRTCDTAGPGRLTINAYSRHCLIALSTLHSIIQLSSSLVG